jgi:hypothetical protein
LTACAGDKVIKVDDPAIPYRPQSVPPSLLTCPKAPPLPAVDATDRQVAAFIANLSAAHLACFDHLGGVRALLSKREAGQ